MWSMPVVRLLSNTINSPSGEIDGHTSEFTEFTVAISIGASNGASREGRVAEYRSYGPVPVRRPNATVSSSGDSRADTSSDIVLSPATGIGAANGALGSQRRVTTGGASGFGGSESQA